MVILFILVICAAVALVEALLIMLVSKRIKGPTIRWRTAIYWGCVVVLVSGFLSSLTRSPRLSESVSLLLSLAGWAALHVGLGGLFLTGEVRASDGARQPWGWGAKITGAAGALLTIGAFAVACVYWFLKGATS
jgi:hypothetical protein